MTLLLALNAFWGGKIGSKIIAKEHLIWAQRGLVDCLKTDGYDNCRRESGTEF